MHPDLKAVIEVQQLDQQVAELTVLIDSLPKQIQTLQSQLDNFIHAHEDRKKRLAANLKERKELEGEVKVIQEKITKHKDQLYQVKTNEQYKAMLKEIDGEEGNIRKIEDQILEKMIEAEDIQKHIQEAAARLEGEKARVAAEIKHLQDERQKDLDERALLQEVRVAIALVHAHGPPHDHETGRGRGRDGLFRMDRHHPNLDARGLQRIRDAVRGLAGHVLKNQDMGPRGNADHALGYHRRRQRRGAPTVP